MLNELMKKTKEAMQKSVESLKHELSKLRTGRAHPSLLDHIKVDYYGTPTSLHQVSNITVEGARALVLTPFEKNMVAPIEKAILTSNLGLNPSTAGTVIRIPMPPLTEERRRDLTRVVREEGEQARVSVRNGRRDANSELKELLKEKLITEDEGHRAEADIQKMTNQFVAEIDTTVVAKEKDLMEV